MSNEYSDSSRPDSTDIELSYSARLREIQRMLTIKRTIREERRFSELIWPIRGWIFNLIPKRQRPFVDVEDTIEQGILIFLRAIKRHDFSKSGFAYDWFKREFSREMARENKRERRAHRDVNIRKATAHMRERQETQNEQLTKRDHYIALSKSKPIHRMIAIALISGQTQYEAQCSLGLSRREFEAHLSDMEKL